MKMFKNTILSYTFKKLYFILYQINIVNTVKYSKLCNQKKVHKSLFY
jgi:hypothetical protein